MTKDELLAILGDKKKSFAMFGTYTSSITSKALATLEEKLKTIDEKKKNLQDAVAILSEVVKSEKSTKLKEKAKKFTEAELEAMLEMKKGK